MTRVGVLASGRGSNLQALIDASRAPTFGAELAVVVSNHKGALALERAEKAGIPTVVCEREDFQTRREQHLAMGSALEQHGVDLLVTAGFDRILLPEVTARYRDRFMNIHPSLLPAFGGGLHAQADALEYGAKIAGCTVHFCTDDVDAGPIVLQAAVPILEDDTVDTLSERILAEEHRILPEAVRLFAAGRLRVAGRRVRILS